MKPKELNSYRETPTRMGGLHRRYRRGDVAGFSCDIADGNRLVAGVVDNISTNGFKIHYTGNTFSANEHCYQAVVSGNGRHYKIFAKPCWQQQTDSGQEIGFKIIDVSWEWTEMVLESVSPGDIYAVLHGNA